MNTTSTTALTATTPCNLTNPDLGAAFAELQADNAGGREVCSECSPSRKEHFDK
jgi:hypothetical protein